MKTVFILFLLLSVKLPAISVTAVPEGGSYALPTVGLNGATHEPLPGSDWEVAFSTIFAGNCNAFETQATDFEVKYYDSGAGQVATKTVLAATGSNYNNNNGDAFEILNVYLPRHLVTLSIPEDCSTAAHENDPMNILQGMGAWNDVGLSQNTAFGTDTLLCGYENSCGKDGVLVAQSVTEADQVFSTLTPTAGVDGTAPGKGEFFVYDINSLVSSNSIGYGGLGGQANLNDLNTTRYCVRLKDYATEGAASPFALNPTLDMYVYEYYPVKQSASQAQGVTPNASSYKIQIYKKMDSNMRYFLRYNSIDNPVIP